jgi:tetratricopeptide (TPR) repeat protein
LGRTPKRARFATSDEEDNSRKFRRILDPYGAAARLAFVARVREALPVAKSAERHLERAISARSSQTRAKYAKLGLSGPKPVDRTTRAMLLRQLYLAHYEARDFAKALEVARQLLQLQILPDVAHQDAARACQALGELDGAVGHLRLAARVSPPSRRAFHFWTLGGLLYLRGRYDDAASMLARAARWGTTDKPLYVGHAALARCAGGEEIESLDRIIADLESAACGQGYGRFVLGRLCAFAGRSRDARRYLEAFIRRTRGGRPALTFALEGELADAEQTLAALPSE